MALNKRKVLETARKHAQKGAKAKALKEYNKLLKAEPRDAKLLLEVGDAYRRWGQAEEAIAQYGKVAQQYRQDGFDARAVAVFKQILNLDPKHYAAYVSLSELYQRMGLDSEAISALQTAADGYYKEGRKTEALDLLRQTAALDPTNTTSRLKVAELLRQEGMDREALSEYQAVADELESQGDREQGNVVLERILEVNPEQNDALTSLVKNLMASSEYDRAETFAIRLLGASNEPSQHELLMELYSLSGADEKLADATRALAKLYRDRGDEEAARNLMQRMPVEESSSNSRLAVDVSEVAEPDLADDDLLDEEPFLSLDDEGGSLGDSLDNDDALDIGGDDLELEISGEEPPAAAAAESEPLPVPEGDPDQLLAEANVYLRYGKRDQAIASLRGVLAQEPAHQAALEKLGEAYAADGQKGPAVETWQQAATGLREAGDAEAFSVLKDRVAALDPAAAEQMGTVEVASNEAEKDAPETGLDVEVDLDLDAAIDEVSDSETQSGLSLRPDEQTSDGGSEDLVSIDHDDDEDDDEFEIEIDDEQFEIDADLGVDESLSEADSTTASISVENEKAPDFQAAGADEIATEPGIDLEASLATDATASAGDESSDQESVEFDFDVDELSHSGTQSSTGQSTTTAAKIAEELEEAEFYLAQDMCDEAETILLRVLELVPNHPSAMLRMGEIAAARGDAPNLESAAAASNDVTSNAPDQTLDGVTEDLSDAAGLDITVESELPEVSDEAPVDEPDEEEIQVDLSDDDDGVEETIEAAAPPAVEEEVTAPAAAKEAVPDEPNTVNSGDVDGDESFDLREALADVLEDDEMPSDDASSGVLSTVEDGFGSIFSEFKKGVSATLEEGDFETRYDLGIAYREMGLYEDALGEFRVCLDSPPRRFDSLYMMGICARDLTRYGDAVNHFDQALALPEIPEERLAGVYFDLSIAQQGAGEIERACASLRKTIELDAKFPTAAERLTKLEADGESSPSLAQPGEEFESFDELFADDDDDEGGDEAMIEAVPVETFESFDDVVAEAEESADVVEEPDPGATSGADTKSGKKGGRKKISFV